MRTQFSNVLKGFDECAIKNSEPITYCIGCGRPLSDVIVKYNDLIANEKCKGEYFNQDRLNILEILHTNALSLWDAGSCSSKSLS